MRKPYVILIGSASGIGKSTIAAELAKQLNIKHLIESDFIRAVVRGIIGKEYAPALHSSSYDAYKQLRNKNRFENYNDLVSAGFDEHASYVIPALEKIIQRAITDYDDIVIEGVHLVPGLIDIEQFKELKKYTTNEWRHDYNGTGVNGRLFTSKQNGNTIFFPANGLCNKNTKYTQRNDLCAYWTNKLVSQRKIAAFGYTMYKNSFIFNGKK